MVNNEYDVIIIGAGPAGCCAARFLKEDFKTLLLDWSRFPRDKPCGALLVEEAQEFVRKMGIPKAVFSYPGRLDLKRFDWENSLVSEEKRGMWNVSRRSFDYWLLNEARKRAEFYSGTKFLGIEKRGKAIKILVEKQNKRMVLKSRFVVGSDGAFSSVRRGLNARPLRYYFAVQDWIRTDVDTEGFVYFIYDNEITDFYSWVIPKGNYIIIGSALPKGNDAKGRMSYLKERLREDFGMHGSILKSEGALISRPESVGDVFLGRGNVMLSGEASGLISPSTGEGISFALRSGYNCAMSINEDSKRPIEVYKRLCGPLVDEIGDKAKKAHILSNTGERARFFK